MAEGKGGGNRTAYLNDYAREVLRLYIEEVREHIFTEWNKRNNDLLFGTGWAWLEHLVNGTLREVAARLSLGAFSSHGFRHALGYHLLRAGCNIRHIQEIPGAQAFAQYGNLYQGRQRGFTKRLRRSSSPQVER